MSASPKTYTIDQIAVAARQLREAAGGDPERYTIAEVASLLSGEIGVLGASAASPTNASPASSAPSTSTSSLARSSAARQTPANFIRRLLWGRLNRARTPRSQMQTE